MILIPPSLLPIEMLLQIIINDYISESYCLTVISETPLNIFLPMGSVHLNPKNTANFTETMLTLSEAGCSDYIVRMEDPRQFMVALEEVGRRSVVRRSDKKLVILPDSDDAKMSDIVTIFTMKECSFYANLLVIVPNEDVKCKTFDLVTHRFIGPDTKSQFPVKLDSWYSCTNQFENNAYLFPHDLKNLNGKTMKIGTFTYKPYVLLDLDTSITPIGRDGIEIRIIDEFCRWINCTIELVREDKDMWGEIYENQTGIGLLASVFEGRCNIGIASLYSWFEEWELMDFSIPAIRSAITCLVPSPRILASWELPLLPFTQKIWIALLITFIITCMGLTVAQGCSANKALLIVFGSMIGQSQFITDESWRIRSVIGWILVSSVILVNAYGAGLASTFTVPQYEPSIDTVKDLIDRRMEWGANHEAWIYSLTMSVQPLAKSLINQFRVYNNEELKRLSFLRKMAFSLEKLPAGTFAIGEYLTKEAIQDMQLLLEDFYFEQNVAMLRKNSPYTDKLNQLIGRLHQSGLLLAWESQVALKYLDYKIQLETKYSRTRSDVGDSEPLSLKRLEGIFMIFVAGILIATIFFVSECLVHNYRKKRLLKNT